MTIIFPVAVLMFIVAIFLVFLIVQQYRKKGMNVFSFTSLLCAVVSIGYIAGAFFAMTLQPTAASADQYLIIFPISVLGGVVFGILGVFRSRNLRDRNEKISSWIILLLGLVIAAIMAFVIQALSGLAMLK